jgi:hypothetical protein
MHIPDNENAETHISVLLQSSVFLGPALTAKDEKAEAATPPEYEDHFSTSEEALASPNPIPDNENAETHISVLLQSSVFLGVRRCGAVRSRCKP